MLLCTPAGRERAAPRSRCNRYDLPGIGDLDGLRDATEFAAQLGYDGKTTIHQKVAVHDAFTPRDEEIAWTERIIAAAKKQTLRLFRSRRGGGLADRL